MLGLSAALAFAAADQIRVAAFTHRVTTAIGRATTYAVATRTADLKHAELLGSEPAIDAPSQRVESKLEKRWLEQQRDFFANQASQYDWAARYITSTPSPFNLSASRSKFAKSAQLRSGVAESLSMAAERLIKEWDPVSANGAQPTTAVLELLTPHVALTQPYQRHSPPPSDATWIYRLQLTLSADMAEAGRLENEAKRQVTKRTYFEGARSKWSDLIRPQVPYPPVPAVGNSDTPPPVS